MSRCVEPRALGRSANEGERHVGDGHTEDEDGDEQGREEEVCLTAHIGCPTSDQHGRSGQEQAEEE